MREFSKRHVHIGKLRSDVHTHYPHKQAWTIEGARISGVISALDMHTCTTHATKHRPHDSSLQTDRVTRSNFVAYDAYSSPQVGTRKLNTSSPRRSPTLYCTSIHSRTSNILLCPPTSPLAPPTLQCRPLQVQMPASLSAPSQPFLSSRSSSAFLSAAVPDSLSLPSAVEDSKISRRTSIVLGDQVGMIGRHGMSQYFKTDR
jgi:hypothetical protein